MQMLVGPVNIEVSSTPVPVKGEAFTGGHQNGIAMAGELRAPDGAVLEVALVEWEHGDRDVRCFSRLAGPVMYDRLITGARLGVAARRPGDWDCELGILTHHDERPPTVVKATWHDLDSVLGSSAERLLIGLGATAVGTKEETIADTGRRRGYLVMVSPQGQAALPLSAYVLTRVLPLMTGFGSAAAVPVGLA
jgi:hypothetical protein